MSEAREPNGPPENDRLIGALETILDLLVGPRLAGLQESLETLDARLSERLRSGESKAETAADRLRTEIHARLEELQATIEANEREFREFVDGQERSLDGIREAAAARADEVRKEIDGSLGELRTELARSEESGRVAIAELKSGLEQHGSVAEQRILAIQNEFGPRIDEIAERSTATEQSYRSAVADVSKRVDETRTAMDEKVRLVQERLDGALERKFGDLRMEIESLGEKVGRLRDDLGSQAQSAERVSAVLKNLSHALAGTVANAGGETSNAPEDGAKTGAAEPAQREPGELDSNGDLNLEETLDEMLRLGPQDSGAS